MQFLRRVLLESVNVAGYLVTKRHADALNWTHAQDEKGFTGRLRLKET